MKETIRNENKELAKLIGERISKLACSISEEFETYNTVQTIIINGCNYTSNATYQPIRSALIEIDSAEEFNSFKEEILEAFLKMEKAELNWNKELQEKYIFLNGFDPEKYEYNIEADLFVRFEELEEVGSFKEFNEIAKEQKKEKEAEMIIEVDEKVNDLFLN